MTRITSGSYATLLAACLSLVLDLIAQPVVSNVRAAQRVGTGLVEITYDLVDNKYPSSTVSIEASTNGGTSYIDLAGRTNLSGAIGNGVKPGTRLKAIWNAGADLAPSFFPDVRLRLTAIGSNPPPSLDVLIWIPAGTFLMGDLWGDGYDDEFPIHSVSLPEFTMDKFEVSKTLWDDVYIWATGKGYSFENAGSGKGLDHPVHTVNWYDVVKWCNARSEKEGRTPAYYTSAEQKIVYRSGRLNVQSDWVKWNAGYRLPTESEWEYAARGGGSHRFGWSDVDTITQSRANYYSDKSYSYDVNPVSGYHTNYNNGIYPYTSPVTAFSSNGYLLRGMTGNVWEWCWDWYGVYSDLPKSNPFGPLSGSSRILRGGSWNYSAFSCRVAHRDFSTPGNGYYDVGFRTVLPTGR